MTTDGAAGLRLAHEADRAVQVTWSGRELLRYVYRPDDPQLESPRPYFHPVHTLAGDLVTLYRPHDHVWHKGIAWSLPNVGPANFWGGTTYVRGRGYLQLPNDGSMRHRRFEPVEATPAAVRVSHRLDWVTEAGETWFHERRAFAVGVDEAAGAWTLAFGTAASNVTGAEIVIGSPTTQGRDNAGYGGLFWRGPRSFTGGRVYGPDGTGGDELMGCRAPWLGFAGRHDGSGRDSTLVFVDAARAGGQPTRWFVRSTPFAAVCPAPFFSTELPVRPGATFVLRYAVVVADGDRGVAGAAELARVGAAALAALPALPEPVGLPELAEPAGLAEVAEPAGLAEVAEPAGLAEVAEPAGLAEVAEPAGLAEVAEPAGTGEVR